MRSRFHRCKEEKRTWKVHSLQIQGAELNRHAAKAGDFGTPKDTALLLHLCMWLDSLATQVIAILTSAVQAGGEAQNTALSVWRSVTKLFLQQFGSDSANMVAGTEARRVFFEAVQIQAEIRCC
jgi:hypothetical protein